MNMRREAGVWNKLRGLWRKWRGKGEVDPSRVEDQIVQDLSQSLFDVVESQANPFIRAVVEMANKHKLPPQYLQYVFWLIAEKTQSWPSMRSGYADALSLGRDIVLDQLLMPNYRDGLVVPSAKYEETVDKVVEWVAFWVITKMKANLLRSYLMILKRLTPNMQKALGDRLPSDKALPYLKELFEAELAQFPGRFPGGPMLDRVFYTLLK